ncbi:MAG: hypothetical protein OCC49_04615 [Fibrobacterales bacterium]
MIEQLKILKEIDVLDMGKIKLASQQKVLPGQINILKEKVLAKKGIVEQTKNNISTLEADIENLKKEVENEKLLLEKSNTRLNTIANNKEFDAVQNEIATHESKIEHWELSELEKLEELEGLNRELPEYERVYVEISKKYKPEFDKLNQVYRGIAGEAQEIDKKIIVLKEKASPKFLNYYEKLLKSKYPLLLSHKQSNIVGELKNGETACDICGSEIRKPRIQAIRKNDSIHCCDDCGSILMWNEDK